MLDLESHWLIIMGLAVAGGLLGGLAAELLIARSDGQTGVLEIPHRRPSPEPGIDIGFIAPMVVGVVAALAVLWLLPPETHEVVQTNAAGDTSTTSESFYSWVYVLAVALVAGTGGSAFIEQARQKANLLTKANVAETERNAAEQEKEQVKTEAAKALSDLEAEAQRLKGSTPSDTEVNELFDSIIMTKARFPG